MKIERLPFGTFYNQKVNQITMTNDNGMSVSILELGGIITQLWVKNSKGELRDIVLGFDSIQAYTRDKHYFGALIGRVANRISGAQFQLNNQTEQLDGNAYQGRHCVHGGRFGYHRRVWQEVDYRPSEDAQSLTLALIDADGEEGFRHTLSVRATYTLNNEDTLTLEFNATSDGPSPINLTSHSYFNLFGHNEGNIAKHTLSIFSDHLLGQDHERIPTGVIEPVATSHFDFSQSTNLSLHVTREIEINHSYLFDHLDQGIRKLARLEGDGRVLTIYSNESTLHFYNGHNLDGLEGKQNSQYCKFSGLCLEPKGYVNAVNQHNFPCQIIDVGKPYNHTIIYKFN